MRFLKSVRLTTRVYGRPQKETDSMECVNCFVLIGEHVYICRYVHVTTFRLHSISFRNFLEGGIQKFPRIVWGQA